MTRVPDLLGADQRRLVDDPEGYNPYDYFGIDHVVREDIFWLDKT